MVFLLAANKSHKLQPKALNDYPICFMHINACSSTIKQFVMPYKIQSTLDSFSFSLCFFFFFNNFLSVQQYKCSFCVATSCVMFLCAFFSAACSCCCSSCDGLWMFLRGLSLTQCHRGQNGHGLLGSQLEGKGENSTSLQTKLLEQIIDRLPWKPTDSSAWDK